MGKCLVRAIIKDGEGKSETGYRVFDARHTFRVLLCVYRLLKSGVVPSVEIEYMCDEEVREVIRSERAGRTSDETKTRKEVSDEREG